MKKLSLASPMVVGMATIGITALSSAFSVAQAASMSFDLSPFTGSPAGVNVTLTDDDNLAGAGKILFTVDVNEAINLADIRGIFFNVADDSILSGLSVTGSNITQAKMQAGSLIDLGGGNNLNGGGTPGPFDVALEIGTSGIGKDDIGLTTFTLSHSSRDLDLSLFSQQSFGVRLTSVGPTAKNRGGSSKLGGSTPIYIPEPPEPEPTEVPEPGIVSAIALFALGSFRFLKRGDTAQA